MGGSEKCSHAILKIPVRLEAFTEVLGCSEFFWGFSIVLKQFWKFYGVFWCSGVFWGFIVGSEGFNNVPNSCEVSTDILGCSVEFWSILMCSEQFLYTPEESESFSDILGVFSRFSDALWGLFYWFWALLKGFFKNLRFYSDVLGSSEAFLMCSRVLWAVLKVSWRIYGVFWCLTFSESFWSILMGSEGSWKVAEDVWWAFWRFPSLSEAFSSVLSGCERFLKCSEVFSNVLGYSEVFCSIWRHCNWFWVVLKRFLK